MEINIQNENTKNLEIEQKKFLDTGIGKLINKGIDFGLKTILPDFIEDEIIEIKDIILENGFKDGLNKAIETGINIGKSALGIVSGKFENTTQLQMAVEKGGIIDSVSNLLDKSMNLIESKKVLDSNTINLIKKGKNIILNQISKNIEEGLTSQIKSIEKMEKYCEEWMKHFKNWC